MEDQARVPPKAVISIVDDDEAVRITVASLLRSLDYSVHTFGSAEEFLQSPQLHHTSCLISDVQMPGLSGIELQARLHADGHRIPVIFVTAHPDACARDRAIRAGAISFMSKPMNATDLIRSLTRALKLA